MFISMENVTECCREAIVLFYDRIKNFEIRAE